MDRRILNANTARPKVPRGWTLAQEAMEAWGSPAKRPRVFKGNPAEDGSYVGGDVRASPELGTLFFGYFFKVAGVLIPA